MCIKMKRESHLQRDLESSLGRPSFAEASVGRYTRYSFPCSRPFGSPIRQLTDGSSRKVIARLSPLPLPFLFNKFFISKRFLYPGISCRAIASLITPSYQSPILYIPLSCPGLPLISACPVPINSG